MTLKQLEVFLAVADSHSFSKGGEAVSLAQSTASQHLRALEEELGARLLDRSATRVTLTEVGRLFYDHAARICRQCAEARDAVRRFQGLEQATLRLGGSTIPAACLIPDLLGRFSAEWPGVRLELQQADTREVIRLVHDDQVELAIVGGRCDEEGLCFRELLADRILLVAAAASPLPSTVSLQQLAALPLVQREPGSGTRTAVEAALQKAGFDPRGLRVTAQLGSSEAIRRAVLGGAGCAFLSAAAINRELSEGLLRQVTVAGLSISRSFYLVWRRGSTLSPAAGTFMQAALAEAAARGNDGLE